MENDDSGRHFTYSQLQAHDARTRRETIDKISKLFASKIKFLDEDVARRNYIDYRLIEWETAVKIFAQLEKEQT